MIKQDHELQWPYTENCAIQPLPKTPEMADRYIAALEHAAQRWPRAFGTDPSLTECRQREARDRVLSPSIATIGSLMPNGSLAGAVSVSCPGENANIGYLFRTAAGQKGLGRFFTSRGFTTCT